MRISDFSRRDFIRASGVGALALSIGGCFDIAKKKNKVSIDKPNVLFIITDDVHADHYGFLGGRALTPNIDKLASQGVYFSRSYTSTSVCTPSRFTCLTGMYAGRCESDFFLKDTSAEGQRHVIWNSSIEPDRPNIASVLQANGYATGIVGKCHGIPGNACPSLSQDSDPTDPEVAKTLEVSQADLIKQIKKSGFDYAASLYRGNIDYHTPKALRHHNMEWITSGALDFLDENKDNQFFLYFSTTLPHSPAPDPVASLKADPRITEAGLLDKPIDVQPSRQSVLDRVSKAGFNEETAGTTWIDDAVGVLMNKLDELGLADNTIVFFFNDHGSENLSKGTCYEGGVKTQSIIRYNGKAKPQICDKLVQNIDLAPTIFDVCDITPPEDMHLDGKSLMPLVVGKEVKWRDSLFFEIGYTRSVCTGKWRYVAFRVPPSKQKTKQQRLQRQSQYIEEFYAREGWEFPPKPEARTTHLGIEPGGIMMERHLALVSHKDTYFDADQLYDLQSDPMEQNNLASSPEYQEVLKRMKKLLSEYIAKLPETFGEF